MNEVTQPTENDLNKVVRSLFRDKDWMVKTGVGGILTAITFITLLYSVLCLPLAMASWATIVGYTLRTMRRRIEDGEAGLPEWNEWMDLFMSGITWIAFQFCIWLFVGGLSAGLILLSSFQAWQGKTQPEMYVWIAGGLVLGVLMMVFSAMLSAFVMVKFAVEENAKSALAFPQVMAKIRKAPAWYASGFIIAVGLQWLWVLVPIATVVGSLIVPTTYFTGQLMSAYVLAYFWSAEKEA